RATRALVIIFVLRGAPVRMPNAVARLPQQPGQFGYAAFVRPQVFARLLGRSRGGSEGLAADVLHVLHNQLELDGELPDDKSVLGARVAVSLDAGRAAVISDARRYRVVDQLQRRPQQRYLGGQGFGADPAIPQTGALADRAEIKPPIREHVKDQPALLR